MYFDKEVKEFLNSISSNGLYLISLPTGFGKTKGVNDFIKENEKVIYITHLKHLINDLDGFDFVLKSDIETIRENYKKISKSSFIYKLESFKKLVEVINIREIDELSQSLISRLKEDLKNAYKKDKSVIDEVEVLFPSVRIEKYKKIATTSHKFIRGFFHFQNGSFLSDVFRDFFVFIDEFNIQKRVFLEVLSKQEMYEVIELYRSFRAALRDGFLQKYGVDEKIIKDIKKKFRKNIPQFTSREDFNIKTQKEIHVIADRFLIENFYEDMNFLREIKSAINSFLGICKEIYKRNLTEEDLKIITQSITTKEPTKNHRFVYNFLKNFYRTSPLISTTSLEDLYNEGFNHLTIKKEKGLDEFWMHGMYYTPERFISELSNKMRVVGISATSLIRSVVSNFDLDYLEVKEVFTKEINIKDNTEIEVIEPKEIDDVYLMDELSLMDEYLKNRFLSFYEVYEKFLDSEMESFLYLENEYLDKRFDKLIQIARKRLNKKHNVESEVFVLRDKKEYKEFLKKKKGKFFIISTYQNVGAGTNLNYDNKDIDGIYLGEITNLIDFENKNSAIYILLSLYHKNLISSKNLNFMLKHLMSMNEPRLKIIPQYKKTDDYVNALMDKVIQGIGRLYRVDKEAKKWVFINYKLYNEAQYFEYEGAVLPVVKRLCKHRKKEESFIEAIKNNEYAKRKINYLLNALDSYKDEYKKLREYIFRNPSCDMPEYKLFYAKLPSVYYYKEEMEYTYVEISKKKKDGFIEFSKEKIYPDILKKLFGWEFDFEKEYKLIPIAWNNIFKGVLGEKIVGEVFRRIGVELSELDEGYEEFDFKVGEYFIDAKNLSQRNIEDKNYKTTIQKYAKRLKKLKGKKGFVINVFGYAPEYKVNKIQEFGDIVVVPYLIDVERKDFNWPVVEYLKRIFND